MFTELEIIDAVPYIHGQRAIWDENEPLIDAFSQWRCPVCKANVSAESLICLNACHLSKESQEGFRKAMSSLSKIMQT